MLHTGSLKPGLRLAQSIAVAVFCIVATVAAGVKVTTLSGPPTTGVVVKQTKQDGSGCTSIRYCTDKGMQGDTRTGDSIPAPFRKPDRDLGQTFKAPRTMKLDAIVIRTGPDGTTGTSIVGQKIAVQLLKVSGTPVLHTGGTTAKTNDWFTGETFTQISVAMDGVLPSGCDKGGVYLKFDLSGTDEITLRAGETYAYMLMLQNRGSSETKLCLANTFMGGSSYPDGHAIRREGGCGIAGKPEYSPDFCPWTQRLAQQPGTWGHPDVCTYRDHVFFIIASESTPVTPRQSATISRHDSQVDARVYDLRGNLVAGATRPGLKLVKNVAGTGMLRLALD